MANKFAYLMKVEKDENNNKFYRMTQTGDTFLAEWGRVGTSGQSKTFPMRDWDKKYRDKIKKSKYEDKTHLYAEKVEVVKGEKIKYKAIPNKIVSEIVSRLQRMAKQAIEENYTISSDKVTQAMIDEAEALIKKLLSINSDVARFNNILMELFRTIPRKMKKVDSYLLRDIKDIPSLIQTEQDLLDVMKGQVAIKSFEEKESDVEVVEKTILDVMGLEIKPVTSKDVALIKDALGELAPRYHNAWQVVNKKTQKAFDSFVKENKIKKRKLLWHGSRNENWWSILGTGLVLRPNAVITGKMFGYGIYFAPKSKKSLGYTSLSGSYWVRGNSSSGFMALFDTAYGVPYDVHSFESKYHSFDYDKLQKAKKGANCLHAHAGRMLRNDEIIYYKEDQLTIKYLVEFK